MTAHGWLDFPTEGAVLSADDLWVVGWATWDGAPARGVVAFLDNQPVGAGRTGVRRTDVAKAVELASAEYAGFAFHLDTSQLSSLYPVGLAREQIAMISVAVLSPDGSEAVTVARRAVHLMIPARPSWADPLIGHLESPLPGVPVRPGKVLVRGWAVVNERPAIGVVAKVNGRPVAFGAVEEDREDLAEHLSDPRLTRSGFSFFVDTEESEGDRKEELELVVSAIGQVVAGRPALGPLVQELARLTVAIDRSRADIEGWIDSPNSQDPIKRAPLNVIGWALAAEGPIAEVEIRVNGEPAGLARLGIPTPTLAHVRESDFAGVAGFEHLVDLSRVPAGVREVTIEARITDLSGTHRTTISRSCGFIDPGEPTMAPVAADPDKQARRRTERQARIAESRASRFISEPDTARGALNLLAVTHELGLGGGQLWLYEFLERSGAGRDYECTVFAQKGGALHGDLNDLGIDVHVTSSFPVDDADSYEGRIREAATMARNWGVNAVLANTMFSFPGADLAARLKLPCVWAIHESFPPSIYWSLAYPPEGVDPLVRSRVEELLASTPAVVFEAEATRVLYLESVPSDHALVVPYGINTAEIERYLATVTRDEARCDHDLAPEQRVLLVMGTTEPRKAQIVLAEAFAQVAVDHPEALLVFVGDTGTAYARSLRDFIDSTVVAGQIRLEPVTSDTYSWYRAADVLVSCSDLESLPRSFLEAMCFGLPVAGASVFGIPELIRDGRTGFLFRPRDLRATVDALRRVLECDSSELLTIANAARAQGLKHYDSAGYVQSLLALLNEQAGEIKRGAT
jgi:D-inositol-3-phosphate glycosyltransferase